MKKIEVTTSQNLDYSYSGVDITRTMNKLKDLVNRNKSLFSSVIYRDTNIEVNQFVNTIPEQQLQRILDLIYNQKVLKKYLVRTIKLNLNVNQNTGELELDTLKDNHIYYNVFTKMVCCKNEIFFPSQDQEHIEYRYYEDDKSLEFLNLDDLYDELEKLVTFNSQNIRYSVSASENHEIIVKE